jgi:hypothetical protein
MMRFRNSRWPAALLALLSLGVASCHSTHKDSEGSANKKAALTTEPARLQTGSNLPRHAYISEETKREDERRDAEKKAKRKAGGKAKKSEKSKSVDEDYVPRGGFR